jgi:hypothetical protein
MGGKRDEDLRRRERIAERVMGTMSWKPQAHSERSE